MSKTILISGASSGFGSLAAHLLADAGHTVHAGMRDVAGRNRAAAAEAAAYSAEHGVALRAVEPDVTSDESARRAVDAEYDAEYETRYGELLDQLSSTMAEIEPPDADVTDVARAIVDVVGAEKGTRPYRVHIDPTDDGAAVVFGVGDRVRAEFLRRVGLGDLLHARA